MSPTRTRTATRPAPSKATVASAVAAKTESTPILGLPKVTGNLEEFRAYVVAADESSKRNAKEREAFVLGNRLAALRARYTRTRGKDGSPAGETFSDYAIRVSGVTVPTNEGERKALLDGIATYSRYVAFRNSKPKK